MIPLSWHLLCLINSSAGRWVSSPEPHINLLPLTLLLCGLYHWCSYKCLWDFFPDIPWTWGIHFFLGADMSKHLLLSCKSFFRSILFMTLERQRSVDKYSGFTPNTVALRLEVVTGNLLFLMKWVWDNERSVRQNKTFCLWFRMFL